MDLAVSGEDAVGSGTRAGFYRRSLAFKSIRRLSQLLLYVAVGATALSFGLFLLGIFPGKGLGD